MVDRRDLNTLAFQVAQQATGEAPLKKRDAKAKSRGNARAEALTPERRSEIAKIAAAKRWGKTEI